MKTAWLSTSIFAALALVAMSTGPASAQEKKTGAGAAKAAAGQGAIKEIAKNDKVRVVEVTYEPGQGSPSAKRPMRVVYAIEGGTLERTYADGTREPLEWKVGDTKIISESRPYSVKNIGKSTVRLLVVYVK